LRCFTGPTPSRACWRRRCGGATSPTPSWVGCGSTTAPRSRI
jgi:hypothetical protein